MGAHTHRAQRRAKRLEQRADNDPDTIAHMADLAGWRAPGVRLGPVLEPYRITRQPEPPSERPRRRPEPRPQVAPPAEPTSDTASGDGRVDIRRALGADHADVLPAVDIVKERRWSPRYPWYCQACDTMHPAHTFCQHRGYSRAYPWFCPACDTMHPAGFACDA